MLPTTHAVDKIIAGLSFVTISQFDNNDMPSLWSASDVEALRGISDFVRRFLAHGHRDLGRSGPVCPFIRASVRMDALSLSVSHAGPDAFDQLASHVCAAEIAFDQLVRGLAPAEDRMFAATVLALPRLASAAGVSALNRVQREAKLRFVRLGRMIGQFYPGCPQPGIRNPAFRPLDAPVPFLAIRHMTLQDAPFMLDDHRYVTSFLAHFGEAGARQLQIARTSPDARMAAGR
jgi:hypothetical protein